MTQANVYKNKYFSQPLKEIGQLYIYAFILLCDPLYFVILGNHPNFFWNNLLYVIKMVTVEAYSMFSQLSLWTTLFASNSKKQISTEFPQWAIYIFIE